MKQSRKKAKITKRAIDAIDGKKGHRFILADTELPGYQVVIGEKTKTFVLEKRIKGVTKSQRKFSIGKYPTCTPEEARDIAERWSILCRDGQDPTRLMIEKKGDAGVVYTLKKKDIKTVTVRKAFEIHFEFGRLSPLAEVDYRSSMTTQLGDWINKPLDELGISELTLRGNHIEQTVSTSRARKVLTHLRAAWNSALKFCQSKGFECPGNPLNLMKINQMYKPDPNKIVVPFQQLGKFIDCLEQLKDDPTLSKGKLWTIKVYLISLFLGMRNGEARKLKWEYLDLENGFFKLPGHIVKNKKKHIKPICDYALNLLREMHLETSESIYVFPSPSIEEKNQGKYISAYREVQQIVTERMGNSFEFSPHATRRTFISLADGIHTPRTVLKALVNHISGDVTDGYCVKGFNPKQDGPHLTRIEKAFLTLRDMYRSGEEVPEVVIDILPKDGESETAALFDEIASLKNELSIVDHLKEELERTKEELLQTKIELGIYKGQFERLTSIPAERVVLAAAG